MSKENLFFKPTLKYKEFMILDLIEKNKNITQRELSKSIGSAVSMINHYLNKFESKGLIEKKYHTKKNVKYFISKKGIERKKLLNIWYFKSAQKVYSSAKENISFFLKQILNRGFKKILLYGAGQVAEIILDVIKINFDSDLEVLAIIDDDFSKHNSFLLEKKIISQQQSLKYDHDGVFISSYNHREKIYDKLIKLNFPKDKIIQFFD